MPAARKRTVGSVLTKLIERINTLTTRLRVLEQESGIVKTRMNSVEANVLAYRKELNKTVAQVNANISKLDKRIFSLENSMKEVIKHVKKLPTSSRVRELENLISIFNPVKSQFVTREELEKMLEEKNKLLNKSHQ